MNTTVNGSSCSFLPHPATARRIGETFAYCLIFVVSLVGNSFIGITVYKTQTLRKPINYFIVNMAMSDLLYRRFWWNRALAQRIGSCIKGESVVTCKRMVNVPVWYLVILLSVRRFETFFLCDFETLFRTLSAHNDVRKTLNGLPSVLWTLPVQCFSSYSENSTCYNLYFEAIIRFDMEYNQ